MISCSVEQPVQESIIDSIIESIIEIDIVELPLSISMIDSCTVEQPFVDFNDRINDRINH